MKYSVHIEYAKSKLNVIQNLLGRKSWKEKRYKLKPGITFYLWDWQILKKLIISIITEDLEKLVKILSLPVI